MDTRSEDSISPAQAIEKRRLFDDLGQLVTHFAGILIQREAFDSRISKLREVYRQFPKSFTQHEIDWLTKIEQQISTSRATFPPYDMKSLRNPIDGAIVYHCRQHFVGEVDGKTKLPELFENPNNKQELRVRIGSDKIEICDPKQLRVVGRARQAHCYRCKGYVGIWTDRCPRCGWNICKHCGACGCMYKKGLR